MKTLLKKTFYMAIVLLFAASLPSYAQFWSDKKKNQVNQEAIEQARISNLNSAQEVCRVIGSQFAVPEISYEPVTPPKFWTNGMLTELGFSQVSLTNWAAGGSGSLALNSYVNAHANYAKGSMFWDNRIQLSYGFIQSYEEGYKKSSDKIVIDSKWGYRAINKFYFSANFNFRSQFSPGFDGNGKVSKFLSPAYTSLGLGIDYKPGNGKDISINIAPFTGNLVIVTDSLLRAKYGNAPNKATRWELGAQLKATVSKEVIKNLKVNSYLTLFSDYLNNPKNMQVNWDLQLTYKLNKYMQAGIRTNLIYDDNILFNSGRTYIDEEGKTVAIMQPRVQLQEVFSLNFAYTFGVFKK